MEKIFLLSEERDALDYKIEIISNSDSINADLTYLQSILKNNLGDHISEEREYIFKPVFASFVKEAHGTSRGSDSDSYLRVSFPKSIEFTFEKQEISEYNELLLINEIDIKIEEFIQKMSEEKSITPGEVQGGKKHSKREVLGKMMVIYKIKGDRKEYVRHKGKLITIKDYKALMKQKAKKESKPKKKKKST